jgi:glycosyltransferase involved in cell wall biosynthesis
MEAGFRNMICSDVFIHHHGSKSHDMTTFAELLRTNEKKFIEKWKERIPKKISAVMIVKDEADFIEKCIKSIYEDVDEIVVVDTGSTDDTKSLAQACGDKVQVFDFEWCDDFSKARNFANEKATGDWCLSVDADEVITGLRGLRDKLIHPYQAFRINTRNYTDKTTATGWIPNIGEYEQEICTGWFPSEKIRFWRNDPRVKFEFPVHEVVEQSIYFLGYSIITDYSIQVHHYGRTRQDYEYGHGNKYYNLLHKQFESGADDLRSLEQLATQAQGIFKFDEALKFWHEVLKIEPDNSAAFLNIGHCHASKQEWDQALLYSHKAWKAKPDSRDAAMNVAVCEFMSGGDEHLAEKICEDLILKHPLYPLPVGLLGAIQKTRSSLYFAGGM